MSKGTGLSNRIDEPVFKPSVLSTHSSSLSASEPLIRVLSRVRRFRFERLYGDFCCDVASPAEIFDLINALQSAREG